MVSRLDGSDRQVHDFSNFSQRQFLFVAQGKKHTGFRGQVFKHLCQRAIESLFIKVYFNVAVSGFFLIGHLPQIFVCHFAVSVLIAANVVSHRKNPGTYLLTNGVFITKFPDSFKYFLGKIGRQFSIASKHSIKKTLQTASISAIQFFKSLFLPFPNFQHQFAVCQFFYGGYQFKIHSPMFMFKYF